MEQGSGNTGPGFRQLRAWQSADDLASAVFRLSENELAPGQRWLGLQIIRAAFSVTSNIAEGYGRSSLRDYARFIKMTGASLNEVENALHFMRRNRIVRSNSLAALEELRWKTGNLLSGLARSLRGKPEGKGEWQRGLIKDEQADYGTEVWDGEALFRVPGSMSPDAEV